VHRHQGVGKGGKVTIGCRPAQLTSPAGVVLLHDFAQRLGLARLLDDDRRGKARERRYPERKAVGRLVYDTRLGGRGLSDLEVWRGAQGTQEVLGVETVLAPPTAGELLRKGDRGAGHDLPRAIPRLPQRVRPQQSATTCPLALDSGLYEQASRPTAGSTKASTGALGSPPLFAVGAQEGEWRFGPLRRGSAPTARGGAWALRGPRQRAPAGVPRPLRAASGFYRKAGVEGGKGKGGPWP
jgi:hypothetical protein